MPNIIVVAIINRKKKKNANKTWKISLRYCDFLTLFSSIAVSQKTGATNELTKAVKVFWMY